MSKQILTENSNSARKYFIAMVLPTSNLFWNKFNSEPNYVLIRLVPDRIRINYNTL